MRKRINYVMAAWSGGRCSIDEQGGYLDEHLKFLHQFEHHIDQITIGHPHNPLETEEYKLALKMAKASSIRTVIVDQPNIGRSYGHWSRTFDKYRNRFDYYLFIEDDYVPWVDNFDDILIEMYEKKKEAENCGFLCGLFAEKNDYGFLESRPHAAIANGISSCDVLQKVWDKYGMLPHDIEVTYHDGQTIFSEGFLKSGYKICDYLDDKNRALYYSHDPIKLRWYSKTGAERRDIIVPIQYARQPDRWKFSLYTYDNVFWPDPDAEKDAKIVEHVKQVPRKLIDCNFST